MVRLLLTLLFLIPAIHIPAKERCRVIVTAHDGIRPYELVIKRQSEDPKNSNLRTKLENGFFECEIETEQIDMFSIVDIGEVEAIGHTARTADFFVEDGATVKIHFDGESLTVDSDGEQWCKRKRMEEQAEEWRKARLAEFDTDKLTEEQSTTLNKKYREWINDYYVANPMLAFLLDLDSQLTYFRFDNPYIASMLDIYHQYYEDKYPYHSVHSKIKEAEKVGYQILGQKYHDFTAYNTDLDTVRAADYFRGKPTLVICWATWCPPCRKEAIEIIPLFNKYRQRGLNAFSLAREFKTADDMKAAVEEDKYPWPCLLDLDEKFKIFNRHGVTSSGLILIDSEGTIVAAGYSPEDIKEKLDELFPES